MLGAIIGDMVGSVYEFYPLKSKDFNIFNLKNRMTDDSFLTLAVARTLLRHFPIDYSKKGLDKIKKDLINDFVQTVHDNPYAGYGFSFQNWCERVYKNGVVTVNKSFGNGAAMRISPVAWIANSEDEVKKLSKAVTEMTHNHPEGLKGAEAIAMCIYYAKIGKSKEEIKELVINKYYPEIANFDFNDLVKNYKFYEICQMSCPQAIYCFLISNSLEDTIRNCIAIGGDCDTTGAMAGAIAEAYYQKDTLSDFEKKFINSFISKETLGTIKSFFSKVNNKKYL